MLRDFALVVMVMPCGLTPVEGIDFFDWFYFSMYACAHVRPTQTHTHNVQYGAFEEWSLTEPQHQPVKRTLPSPTNRQFGPRPRGSAEGGGRRSYNILGTPSGKKKPTR